MSNSFLYTLPSDHVTPSGIAIDTGTEDPDYPVGNAIDFTDMNLGNPSKLTTFVGSWLMDLGSAQKLATILLWHNLDAGLAGVRVQGNATASFASPSLDVAVTVPALRADGYHTKPFVDLRATTGFSVGYRYWRVYVPNANSVYPGMKILPVAALNVLTRGPLFGLHVSDHYVYNALMTDSLHVSAYDLMGATRILNGTFLFSAADAQTFMDWRRACHGRVKPTVLIPSDAVSDVWLARWLGQPSDSVQAADYEIGSLVEQVMETPVRSIQAAWDEIGPGAPEWQ